MGEDIWGVRVRAEARFLIRDSRLLRRVLLGRGERVSSLMAELERERTWGEAMEGEWVRDRWLTSDS